MPLMSKQREQSIEAQGGSCSCSHPPLYPHSLLLHQGELCGQLAAVSQALHHSLTAVPLVGGACCGVAASLDMGQLQDAMDRCGCWGEGDAFDKEAEQGE